MSKLNADIKEDIAFRFKICIFGDAGVGKTSLIQRYLTGLFKEKYNTTIGMDFYIKKLNVEKKSITLQIWDFAGEEKFRFLMPSCAQGADGALFMYDITRYNTLKNLIEWLKIFKEVNPSENKYVPAILLGGKADLQEFRAVPSDDAVRIAKEHGLLQIFECSSKRGTNVEDTFEYLAKHLMKKRKLL
jgi:small GTP-binding protein